MLSKLLNKHIPVDIACMRVPDFIENQDRIVLKEIEKVEMGNGWKRVNICPACGSEDYEPEFRVRDNPLVKCINCELRFFTNIPFDLNDIYQKDYSVHGDGRGEYDEHFEYRRERFGRERITLLETYCGDLSSKTLLDVSCGMGDFLSIAKEVCRHCFGTEFSMYMREFAEKKTGLNIYSDLEVLPEQDIDLITAFDVIEHIPDPIFFMKAISNLLNKNGNLLIYTPNFDSFSVRVMKEHSQLLTSVEHLMLFNDTSLRELGSLVGLEAIHTETRGLDIHSILQVEPIPCHHLQTH